MKNFPPAVPLWGADTLISVLHLSVTDNTTQETEHAVLTNQLSVKRGRPFLGRNGLRRIELDVQDWNARGYSQMLSAPIKYQMNQTALKQPSFVEALSGESDYPARMVFSANFDVYVGDRPVAKNIFGQAIGTDLMTIPPIGSDTLEVDKAIDFDHYRIIASPCAGCRMLLTGLQSLLLTVGTAVGLVPQELREVLS